MDKYLLAKSAKQIDLGLRIIHEYQVPFTVDFGKLDNGKLVFRLCLFDVEDELFARIEETYKNFIL